MSKHKTYIEKLEEVEAFQFTLSKDEISKLNLSSKFAGEFPISKDDKGPSIYVDEKVARLGDWIVISPGSPRAVLSNTQFEAQFTEKVPAPTPSMSHSAKK